MNNKIKINYTNNKKINEMIENRKKLVKAGFMLGGIAIFSEVGATIYAPDPIFSSLAIASVIGIGVCATKINRTDKKIKYYMDTHKNS